MSNEKKPPGPPLPPRPAPPRPAPRASLPSIPDGTRGSAPSPPDGDRPSGGHRVAPPAPTRDSAKLRAAIPLADPPSGSHVVAPARRAPVAGELRVVVVDDDERFRRMAAEPFERRGDEVRCFADGLEALAKCLEDPPDVILTDVQMPRMDGWQLLRLVRARPALANVPVVFLTSLNGDTERLRGYQLGVDAYIPKPYTPDELLVRVHRIVQQANRALPAFAERGMLRGELEHAAPASLLSFLEMERKNGVLLLVGDRVVRVFLRDGRAVRAIVEGDPTVGPRDVMMRILDWTSGEFEFSPCAVTEPDEIGASLTGLILDHAQAKDEAGR